MEEFKRVIGKYCPWCGEPFSSARLTCPNQKCNHWGERLLRVYGGAEDRIFLEPVDPKELEGKELEKEGK